MTEHTMGILPSQEEEKTEITFLDRNIHVQKQGISESIMIRVRAKLFELTQGKMGAPMSVQDIEKVEKAKNSRSTSKEEVRVTNLLIISDTAEEKKQDSTAEIIEKDEQTKNTMDASGKVENKTHLTNSVEQEVLSLEQLHTNNPVDTPGIKDKKEQAIIEHPLDKFRQYFRDSKDLEKLKTCIEKKNISMLIHLYSQNIPGLDKTTRLQVLEIVHTEILTSSRQKFQDIIRILDISQMQSTMNSFTVAMKESLLQKALCHIEKFDMEDLKRCSYLVNQIFETKRKSPNRLLYPDVKRIRRHTVQLLGEHRDTLQLGTLKQFISIGLNLAYTGLFAFDSIFAGYEQQIKPLLPSLDTRDRLRFYKYHQEIHLIDEMITYYSRFLWKEDFATIPHQVLLKFMRGNEFSDMAKKFYTNDILLEIKKRQRSMTDDQNVELLYLLCTWNQTDFIQQYNLLEKIEGSKSKFSRRLMTLLARAYTLLKRPLPDHIREAFYSSIDEYSEPSSYLENIFEDTLTSFRLREGIKNKISPEGYEMDWAFPYRKFNIEVDGSMSHMDAKKDAFRDTLLRKNGWEILRLSKRDVMDLSESVILRQTFRRKLLFRGVLAEPYKPTGRIATKIFAANRVKPHTLSSQNDDAE